MVARAGQSRGPAGGASRGFFTWPRILVFVVVLQGLYILKLKLGPSDQAIAETLVDEVRSEAHDLSGIFSRKDPQSGGNDAQVPRKLGNSDVVKVVSPIVTLTGLHKDDTPTAPKALGDDNAKERQEVVAKRFIISQELMEKTLKRVVEDDDDTAVLKKKIEPDLKHEEVEDGDSEEDKDPEKSEEKEEDGLQVDEWLPLRGPAEGLTCTQWLEKADVFHYSRNFSTRPVRVNENSWSSKTWSNCGVPCEFVTENPVDATFGASGDDAAVPQVMRSMEAMSYYPGNDPEKAREHYGVVMTVHYSSDVPVQYGSWAEYDIMRPWSLANKTAPALAAAFISNCAANNFRNAAVEELMKHLTVDSYGRCHNNKPGNVDKQSTLARYKFSLAFENSCEAEYVTEKFWQSLVAGTVPVVVGAPNILNFAPTNDSILHIKSLEDVPAVAQAMLAISKDDATFSHMLRWKTAGPSDDFLANMDLSCIHSSCRLCILLADRIWRKEEGKRKRSIRQRPCRCRMPNTKDSSSTEERVLYHIYVRERGTFHFSSVFLRSSKLTLKAFRRAVRRRFRSEGHVPVWVRERPKMLVSEERIREVRIHRIYPAGVTMKEALWGSAWFRTDSDLEDYLITHPCAKLEVIIV